MVFEAFLLVFRLALVTSGEYKMDVEEEGYENIVGYELTFEEMRFRLSEVYGGLAEVRKTVRSVFSAASLIIALIGALQIFSVKVQPAYYLLYSFFVGLTMFLYFLLIVGSIKLLSPTKMKGPIPADLDILYYKFISHEDTLAIYRQLMVQYVDTIKQNEAIVENRYAWAKWVSYLLPAIVLILLGLSLIPRTPLS